MLTQDKGPDSEVAEVLKLAEGAFVGSDARPGDYLLVRAERLLQPGRLCGGPQCWRLTYKLKRLVPDEANAEIGKGGELFIEADMKAGQAKIVGFGE